jgi:quercetin dioxygenase-like cupin family protein
MKTEPPTAASNPALPPAPCANHAVAEAQWRCPACAVPLCRKCVCEYGRPPDNSASCRKCGERCKSIVAGPTPEEVRGGAETPQEAARRHQRDHILPRAVLIVAALGQIAVGGSKYGVLLAVLTLPIWAAVVGSAYGLVLFKLQIEVEDLKVLGFKAAAMALTVHVVRLIAIGVLDLHVPEDGMSAIGMLLPLAICFIFVPAIIIVLFLNRLFELEMSEQPFAIVGLMTADAFMFAAMNAGLGRRRPVVQRKRGNTMDSSGSLRFVTRTEMQVEQSPWGPLEWLSRPGLTQAQHLLLIRVRIPPGKGHQFHRHPHQEEIIYVESGEVEQWVDRDCRQLKPGESAHIPANMVHGSYNYGQVEAVLLAILSPAKFDGPALVDVCQDEPWRSIKKPLSL